MQKAKMLLVQVDNVTGETLGFAIQQLTMMGAKNVQLLQSLTKKNRPSHVLLIDIPEEKVKEVAFFLVRELGIWGYHIIDSHHYHFDISFVHKRLIVKGLDFEKVFELKVKRIYDQGRLMSLTVEHDFLVDLCQVLHANKFNISVKVLRAALETRLWNFQDRDMLELDLSEFPI